MKKYVVISSTASPLYAPFLPITTAFWKAAQYDVLSLLTLDYEWGWSTSPMRHIVSSLKNAGAEIRYVNPVWDFKLSTVAQVSRLAAAALPLEEDVYLLTGDVDMLPLSPKWFHSGDPSAAFHVFNSDAYRAYSSAPTNFPICYLGGTVAAWRELMDLPSRGIDAAVSSLLSGERDHWNLDEELVKRKFTAWPRLGQCQLIERGYAPGTNYAKDRLDRGDWTLPADLSTLIDCHSARPLGEAWTLLRKLVDHFLPGKTGQWVYDYVSDLTLITDAAR